MNYKEMFKDQAEKVWDIIEKFEIENDDRTVPEKATWFAAMTSAAEWIDQMDVKDLANVLMTGFPPIKIETVQGLSEWMLDSVGVDPEEEVDEDTDVFVDHYVVLAKQMWKND